RSSAGTAPRQRRGVFRPRHRLAVQRSERRRAQPQRRPRSGPDEHGRPSRPTAHADGPEGSAEAARRRTHPSVPRHLRAASITHSAGTGDGHDEPRRSHGARKTRERTTGSTVTLKRLHWIVTCAALVAALQMTSAQTGQPPPPSQAPPAQTTTQPPPTPPPAGQGRQQPSFRAGVDLVSLNVTVIDGTARYITDLAAQDFNVFEDGVKQEVTFFNRTNLPIALALLLDTSASMEAKLGNAQEAAIGFARKLLSQ